MSACEINIGRRILFARLVTCDSHGQVLGWVYGARRARKRGERHVREWTR